MQHGPDGSFGMIWGWWEGEGNVSHLMAGHPAYEGGWRRPRQAHYLLQLVYIYSIQVKGHHNNAGQHVKEVRKGQINTSKRM